jgi:hypothetical protein
MFPRPCPQRLDDVGDMVSAGVRLPASVPRARCLQLNLEARHVLARRIRVASIRRRPVVWCNHVPPGSPGAFQSDGVRRAVIGGIPPWKAWQKDGPPPQEIARRPRSVRLEAILSAPGCCAPPHWEYSSQYSLNCIVARIRSVLLRGDGGKLCLIATEPAASIGHPFLVFHLMFQDCGNDPARGQLIFLRLRRADC